MVNLESCMIEAAKHPAECFWHCDWHACNCGLFGVLVYSEPDEESGSKIVRVTVEDAINAQIKYAKNMGYFYQNQSEALGEFISLHWARYEIL